MLKIRRPILLLLITLIGLSAIHSQDIRVHDPVVIQEGSIYYLFCTGNGISVFASKDLKNWEKRPPVFKEAPDWANSVVVDFKNHIWAPDISFHNGTYYLYYSISAFGKNTSAIGLATNTTLNPAAPDFKWEDQGRVVESVPGRDLWNAIDPNLIFDEKNQPWLAFGSFWEGLKIVQLSDNLKSIAHPEVWYTIARRERSFNLDASDPGNAALEAPFIFKKNGYYYQFLSWDYCCRGENSTYKMVVGRSKTVSGPYVDKSGKLLNEGGGSLILEGDKNWYGVGHNSAYTFGDIDYLFFHAYDANDQGSPKLKIAEMMWDQDLWPLLKHNL